MPLESNGLGYAPGGLREFQRHFATNVGTPADTPPAASPTSEQVPKHPAAEDVAERLEDVTDVVELRGTPLDAGMAEAIIASPLLLVVEDLEGLRGFLELFDGRFIPRITIRVVLHCQFAVSLGNLRRRGVSADAKHLVIIGFSRHFNHGQGKGV
jgi:hypothetical protein